MDSFNSYRPQNTHRVSHSNPGKQLRRSTFDLCVYWIFQPILIGAEMDGDALLAQLLGMGFAIEEIERCQVAMATSSRPFSLQEATEW